MGTGDYSAYTQIYSTMATTGDVVFPSTAAPRQEAYRRVKKRYKTRSIYLDYDVDVLFEQLHCNEFVGSILKEKLTEIIKGKTYGINRKEIPELVRQAVKFRNKYEKQLTTEYKLTIVL